MSEITPELSKEAFVTGAFIGKRLEDNLQAFKKHVPEIYEEFKAYQEKRYFLIYGTDGEINLLDREEGVLLYDGDPINKLISTLDEYIESPVCRPYYLGGGDTDFEFIIPVHYKSVTAIGQRQLEVLSGILSSKYLSQYVEGIDANGGVVSLSAGMLPNFINNFFVFSTGLGFDIERLYFDRDVRKLYVVESNKDSFYASLQLIDWAGMLEKSLDKGFSIHFFVSEEVDELLDDLSTFINSSGRHNVAGSYLYSSFYQVGDEEIYEGFRDNLDLSIFAGFGFYDDSRMSVAHTVLNTLNDVPCIKHDRSINKSFGQSAFPVFLVGSGPSLDNDIEFLKENRSKAVVISCGSSLKALYVNGIKPDIHVELERTAHVLHWLKNTSEDKDFLDYLKDIYFVGMSQVHPDVFKLFKAAGQMPKDNETGSLLMHKVFSEYGVSVIARTAPTCVHAGFTAAVLFGFKDIYLFGVDMGYKSYDSHHSKYSLYTELSDDTSEKLVPSNKGEKEVEANFEGETVFTSGYFPMFRRSMSSVVSGWRVTFRDSLNIYNCSDGAKIEGADAKRSYDVDMNQYDPGELDRQNVVADIFASYFAFYPDDANKDQLKLFLEESFNKVDKMCLWLKKQLRKVSTVPEAMAIVDALSYEFHQDLDGIGISEEDGWLYTIFDGTLLYVLSGAVSALSLPIDESVRVDAFNDMVDSLDNTFDEICLDFRENALVADKEEYYDFFSS